MSTRTRVLVLVLSLVWFNASAVAASANRLQRWISVLTDPDLEGRATGYGAAAAAAAIESELKALKLEPAGESGFDVTSPVVWKMSAEAMFSLGTMTVAPTIEFDVTSFSDSGTASGIPVFVGYGISAPALGYDDYRDLDVRGRIVVMMTGTPGFLAPLGPQNAQLPTIESKAATALAHGAVAAVIVNDPAGYGDGEGQRADELFAPKPAAALAGIVTVRTSKRAFTRAASGFDLAAAQQEIERSKTPQSTTLETPIQLKVEVTREWTDAVSLVARVPGTSGPPLLLMAHYDGLARGAYEGDGPYVGADDNASGVAVVLEVAARLAAKPSATHTVYLIFHDAEELGLMGATRTAYFLRSRGIVGNVVNLDMVGRLGGEGLKVFAQPPRCESVAARFPMATQCHDVLDSHSDHVPYARLGYDVVSLSTGKGVDYHRASDVPEKLNFRGMMTVADLLEGMAR
ncbi:MAG: M28 family peptidase [bacterium]